MSSLLKKKTRKKKKKKPDNNEITPQRHEREGNLNYYSEEIVKNIIEKIISLAISTNFTENVEKKSDKFCINLMTKKINTLVEMVHINRDKDDFDIDNINIQSYIKYYETDANSKRYKTTIHDKAWKQRNINAEDKLMEIANIPKDYKTYMTVNNKTIEDCLNNSTTTPKNEYLKKDKLYQYNIDIKSNNFWGFIPQPKNIDIDRTTSNFNCYAPKKDNKNKDSISYLKTNIDKNIHSKKNIHFYKYLKKSNDSKRNEDENSSKKKRIIMSNLPSYPIENLEIRNESEEILNLRKEKLELIYQKERELQELKQKKLKVRQTDKDKKKKKGKFTIDNEGKLILINEIKPENFLKEFWPVMSKQKEIRPGKTLEAVKKEKIKMENDAKKNIEYNEEDRPYRIYLLKSRINESFYDINKDNDKEKDNSNDNANNTNKETKKKNNDIFNDFSIIEPSGSNFQIMNPSVGVKIQEKLKVKNGGTNFYQQFHKYSINEFNKTLQDTIEWSKFRLKERKNDGYMTGNNQISNIKKMISIKEDKEMIGLNAIETKYNNNNYKKMFSKKNFQNTFSNGFHKSKSMIKSKSEIYAPNEKYPKLKQILMHDDHNEKIMSMKMEQNKMKETENIFENRKHSLIGRTNNSMIEEKILDRKYMDIDIFNKKLIMGIAVPERANNRKIVLPKISWRTGNENHFNKTMSHFHRTRIKKGIVDEASPKKNKDEKSRKKVKRINSVKEIE